MLTAQITSKILSDETDTRLAQITITQQDRFLVFANNRWVYVQLFDINVYEGINTLYFKQFSNKWNMKTEGHEMQKQLPDVLFILQADDGNYYLDVSGEMLGEFDPVTGRIEGSEMICEYVEGV